MKKIRDILSQLWLKAVYLIKHGLLSILAGNFLSRAISVISSILIVRFVEKAEYAYLSYADNLYSYLALVSGLGLSTALLKYCYADADPSVNKAYYNFAYRLGGGFQLIVALLICVTTTVVDIPFPAARKYIWLLLAYPLMEFISASDSQLLRCYFETNRYALKVIVQSAILCICSIAFVLLWGTVGVVTARYMAVIGAYLIYNAFIRKKLLANAEKHRLSPELKRAFIIMGLSLTATQLFSSMVSSNAMLLINHIIKDADTTANYRVASQIPAQLTLVSGSIAVYFFPIVSQMRDFGKIKRRGVQIGIITAVVITLISIVGVLLTPYIINLIYSNKYTDAVPLATVIWVMYWAEAAMRTVPINLLLCIGEIKYISIMSIVTCAVHFAFSYVLLRTIGIYGVIFAGAAVYALSGILFWGHFISICRKAQLTGRENIV